MIKRLTVVWNWMKLILQGLAYIVFAIVAVGFVVLGVLEIVDASNKEPVTWVVFTEQRCEKEFRGGCTSYGSWVSDDGFEKFDEVMFDGTIKEAGGSSRAGYQPGGLTSDLEDGLVTIVHAEEYTGIFETVFPFLAALGGVGAIWYFRAKWNDEQGYGFRDLMNGDDEENNLQPRRAA